MHHLILHAARALGDQDVVEDLRDAVEVVGVLLVDRQRPDQIVRIESPVPSAVPVLSTLSDGLNNGTYDVVGGFRMSFS